MLRIKLAAAALFAAGAAFAQEAALDTPVLIIAGDADGSTLEHNVEIFRLLGGGVMGDMGKPLPASRLAILPATSHTALIGQADLMMGSSDRFWPAKRPTAGLTDVSQTRREQIPLRNRGDWI